MAAPPYQKEFALCTALGKFLRQVLKKSADILTP